jgi:hypothetical protein
MRKGRGQAMQNRRSRGNDESSHVNSSEDEAGSADQHSDSADEFAPSSDDNDSAKIKPQTKRPSLTNNEKKQQGLKRKQPISWEDSSSSSREEGESNKKTVSSKPLASNSPRLSETKKQPSKVKSPHKVRPPMSSGKVSATTSSEKAVVSPISSYDILYPTHLGMLGEPGGSSECTLLLQIDSGPNLDTGGPSFDLTGAVGTIGRFETMNDSQNSNRGR